MFKLRPVVRETAMSLEEAKRIAVTEKDETWMTYAVVEIFGRSGAVARGFENMCLPAAPSFDVSGLALDPDDPLC